MSSFSPIIRVRKLLDKMKAERGTDGQGRLGRSPRGVKRFPPSRACSGELIGNTNSKPKMSPGKEEIDTTDWNANTIDMTPIVEQFSLFSNLKTVDSPFHILPNEATMCIFSFLEVSDLFQARLVSKEWCHFADDNLIWKSLSFSDFGLDRLFGNTWKETYFYLEDLFSDGLWEGMSKWIEPEGFDNEQRTTARLHFLKRKKSGDKNIINHNINTMNVSSPKSRIQRTSSPQSIHRVDSSVNATESVNNKYKNSTFRIIGSGITINCAAPSPFQIDGERLLSDESGASFQWHKQFEKHTSMYEGKLDFAKGTVSGTIDYDDGSTHWKGAFYYTKAKRNSYSKYNSTHVNA